MGSFKNNVQENVFVFFPLRALFLTLWWSEGRSNWMLNPEQNTTGGEMS